MPPKSLRSTPTKPVCADGNKSSLSPAKSNPSSPSKHRCLRQSPIKVGAAGVPNNDPEEIAERRRTRQSMTPTKPLGKFDSICQDSKAILNDMAWMFSPKKGESPEASKIEGEAPPVEEEGKGDRRDHQTRDGQEGEGVAKNKSSLVLDGSGDQLAPLQIPSLKRAATERRLDIPR